jgi:hypothetical protein
MTIRIAVFLNLFACLVQAQALGEMCQHVVMRLDRRPFSVQQRVEVRRCGEDQGRLQILAFGEGSEAPVVMEDSREFISQSYIRSELYVFQMEGGAYSDLIIITFRNGRPTLHPIHSYKESVSIRTSGDKRVLVHLPRDAAGTPPRTLVFGFDENGQLLPESPGRTPLRK